MFCPSCGAEAAEGLSYCKRCGAKLAAAGSNESRPKVTGLIWAVSLATVLVTVGGLAVVLGFLVEFGTRASSAMLALLGLLLVVILAVDYLLVRQLSRLIGFHLHGGDGPRAEKLRPAAQTPAEIEAPRRPPTGALEQPTRTLGALEQATRALDPAPGDREPR